MSDSEKNKIIDLAIAQIEKQHGKGAIMRFNSDEIVPVEAIPTGSIGLDIALGVGGLPRGRVIEIYGHEGCGKTTLTLHVVAEAQKLGGVAAFIDVEHAIDPLYAKNIGVDMDSVLISQPDTAEQALEITETLIRSGAIDVVVIDSVAALAPSAEIEGEMGDAHVGVLPRLMSKALRKLSGVTNKSKTCVIFTNQIRQKIGVMFGNPETTPGGLALKFHASVRLEVRRAEALKDGTDQIGSRTRVKVVKNKVAPPFTQVEFDIDFGQGISKVGDLIDVGVDKEIVRKSGAWFYYGEQRLGQGKENAKSFLQENTELCSEIDQKIRAMLNFGENGPSEASSTDLELEVADNQIEEV
ncbi:MAG: recombinase RecA [Candidatus Poribacteria bacterium]|jgi:recombination protein RecA|nr:recombinase RecA [Candidatus Poribacteria bacterium]MDP6750025.1 recombinase RecA [Candidatus Poribacteria bacterium]